MPVLLAAPHAGRRYPDGVWRALRRPHWTALRLEDRHVDRIAAEAARQTDAPLLLTHTPRAVIDLNRANDDIDFTMVAGGPPREGPTAPRSRRARNGLGLIPRRLAGLGEIWKHPLAMAELDARIRHIHTPYHATLADALQRIQRQWGAALLLDLHSMPPLGHDAGSAHYVVGDRFGTSAHDRLTASALKVLGDHAPVAHNKPYAGGYVLERHGQPARNIFALQIEICRSRYLDTAFDQPTDGMAMVATTIAALVRTMAREVAALGQGASLPIAAE